MPNDEPALPILPRNQGEARRVARQHYPFVCCVVCGLRIETCLTIAHLDHSFGNNEPDNLAYLCWTHHWMFDADFYPIEAIKLMRQRWQETKAIPRRVPMIGAGIKAAQTRKRSASAKRAWVTRRGDRIDANQRQSLLAAQRLWVQYRDANCGFYGVQDGSIRQVQAAECMRSMTEDRARELEKAMASIAFRLEDYLRSPAR